MKILALLLLFGLTAGGIAGQKPAPSAKQAEAEYKRKEREANKKHGFGIGALKPGSPAPDFKLKKLDANEDVQLSSFAGKKPVALIFGTYT